MDKNKNQRPSINLMWVYLGIAVLLVVLVLNSGGTSLLASAGKEVTYDQFKNYVEKGYASRIVANKRDGSLRMYVRSEHVRDVFPTSSLQPGAEAFVESTFSSVDRLDAFVDQQQQEGHFKGEVAYEQGDDTLNNVLWSFGPLVLIVLFWMFMLRGAGGAGGGGGPMGIFNVGKSRAKLVEKDQRAKVTFKDVAGLEGAKEEVHEIVDFLRNPQKYTKLGGKIPKGALLVGPPGTGKTLLAKAVAGEADVPFFSMSGSDFVEMFVGVGASRVRDLFRQAKEKAPCIIFIDEIDAVGRARSRGPQMGANDERENTLNQLLTEMDGFGTNSGVIILAATNRADILDKALLRAGRFDRQIYVDLPDVNERKEIFQVHLRPLKTDKSLDIDFLARQTPGFSGADIANVCNEAALIAARNSAPVVTKDHFLAAVDRIVGGLEKKTKVMTVEEKRTIALHEAGHATISWLLQYANPLVKVTIVPRGRALGAAWYLPEERQISTREQLLDEMCALLGGRAAEELFAGHVSSGAMNDLERVTKQAYGMVAYMGMGDQLPNLCYYDNQDYSFQKPYSEHTAQVIDQEVQSMIETQYERAKKLLSEHGEGHARLAQLLVEREVVFAEDVEHIFGPRPWVSRSEELLDEEKADEKARAKGAQGAGTQANSGKQPSESDRA
ncbi:MAG TPA: cell division protein FtsH [Prevotellaceae bacterium]|nr:cell division protein FtsH [Prevotellaceae bacterium]